MKATSKTCLPSASGEDVPSTRIAPSPRGRPASDRTCAPIFKALPAASSKLYATTEIREALPALSSGRAAGKSSSPPAARSRSSGRPAAGRAPDWPRTRTPLEADSRKTGTAR